MEYKVQINSLENFKAWSGGLTGSGLIQILSTKL